MHSLAMLAGKAAFVIKEAEVNLFFGFLYFFRNSMLFSTIPDSGNGATIIFKRSLIGNVNNSKENAYKVIALIIRLVKKSKTR